MACDTMLQIDGANEVQGVPFHCGYKVIGVKCWRPLESSSWKYHVPVVQWSRSGVENIHCALEDQRDGG